jgi:hypothetical protein
MERRWRGRGRGGKWEEVLEEYEGKCRRGRGGGGV